MNPNNLSFNKNPERLEIQNLVLNGNGETKNVIFRDMVALPSTTYATFGLYHYPAKFIPHVIAYVLGEYSKPKMKVFDPFSGCGTVGIMSRLYSCDYELWDLNPIVKDLHTIATMKPKRADLAAVRKEIVENTSEFKSDWKRMPNWFPDEFMPFIYRAWGYYHSLSDKDLKLLLTVPLLKTTRYFSFDDMQRQKLTKSKKSIQRVARLQKENWKERFLNMLENETLKVQKGIEEYNKLSPKKVNAVIRGGVDSLNEELHETKDILITSPPYVQSQEYIRHAKIDLFWLGHSEEEVKALGKLEIPYRKLTPINILSPTYEEYRKGINESHIQAVFDAYFYGVVGVLTRLSNNVSKYMFLFVGHSSTRGRSTPIDKILVEHFGNLGWRHRATLSDTIVSRRLFRYQVNPATGSVDARTTVENLVVLEKIN